MTKRTRRLVGGAVVVLGGIGIAGATATAGPGGSARVVAGHGGHGAGPPAVGPQGRREDVTKPGEHVVQHVWRNGRFWAVQIPVKHEIVTDEATGLRATVYTELLVDLERQLPPRDQALDHVRPTPEQEAAVAASSGSRPGGRPATPAEAVARGPRAP